MTRVRVVVVPRLSELRAHSGGETPAITWRATGPERRFSGFGNQGAALAGLYTYEVLTELLGLSDDEIADYAAGVALT